MRGGGADGARLYAQELANAPWARAKAGTQMTVVFEALWEAAAWMERDFDARNVVTRLWAITRTGTQMTVVFQALWEAAAWMERDFNARNVANELRCCVRRSGSTSRP